MNSRQVCVTSWHVYTAAERPHGVVAQQFKTKTKTAVHKPSSFKFGDSKTKLARQPVPDADSRSVMYELCVDNSMRKSEFCFQDVFTIQPSCSLRGLSPVVVLAETCSRSWDSGTTVSVCMSLSICDENWTPRTKGNPRGSRGCSPFLCFFLSARCDTTLTKSAVIHTE